MFQAITLRWLKFQQAMDMVAGLQHLHTEVGIVHGDLKAVFFFLVHTIHLLKISYTIF